MYSAGHSTDPQPKDRKYKDFSDAVQAALAGCKDDVWQHELGEMLDVVYQRQVFLP